MKSTSLFNFFFWNKFLAFVLLRPPRGQVSSFWQKFNVNTRVNSLLHVDHVSMWVVASSQYHGATGRDFEIELIVNALTIIQFAKLIVHIICDIKDLYWMRVVPNVPDVDRKVVSWEQVVVTYGRKFRTWNRVDNARKEVPLAWVLYLLKNYRALFKLWRNP